MIKFIIFLFSSLLYLNSFSQGVTLKGQVVSKDYCVFLDSGGYNIKKSHSVYNTFFKLTDSELSFTGGFQSIYKLEDKKVEDNGNGIIIHYFAFYKKNLYIVAVRECGTNIQVALFPTDGDSEFVQYTIKLFKK